MSGEGPLPRDIPNRTSRNAWRWLVTSLMVVLTVSFLGLAAAVLTLHLSVQPVLSGSMRPTFAPGAAIVTRTVAVNRVRPGDIIVITPPGWSASVAHRVVTVAQIEGHTVVTTKGDANPVKDPWHAQLDGRSVPEVIGSVPGLGWIINGVEHQWLKAILIGLLGLMLSVGGTRAILRGSGEREAHPPGQHPTHEPLCECASRAAATAR